MTDTALPTPGNRRVSVPLRVQWVDTDAGGRIHFTAAFRWAELAEHELLRAVGATDLTQFPRRHVEATFHRPLRFDDQFELQIEATRVGSSSVTYAWRAMRDDAVYFEGTTAAVHVDAEGTPTPIPDSVRDALTAPLAD
ncbi:thioesterase family protein [Microbacterium sp. STN6]|uniref:acyl-CoA thioesterase n=1 Tax=Microbacterium sp. STN6 TaxID=2995588 RepID=UPI002260A8C8|nr:thioesterase family protein [Microbacterium sp. STN6]MCX7523295.1 thioesterase family protein [Microbacterium sp. STN6]